MRMVSDRGENPERFLNAVLEASAQGILTVDQDGRITLANAGAEQIFGYSATNLVGTRVDMLLPRRLREAHRQEIEKFFREPKNRSLARTEIVCQRKDGSEFAAEVSLRDISDGHGPAAAVFVADVTERKRRDEALREGEEYLRALLERSVQGVAMLDRDMRYIYTNQRWLTDYGLKSDVTGRSHYELFPEIPERWKEVHRRALNGEALHAGEDRFERTDGRVQWIDWEVLPWRTAGGDVGGIFIVEQEVSERKSMQEALRISEERFRLAAEATGFGTFDFDPVRKQVADWSESLYFLSGLSRNEVVTQDRLWALVHPEDLERFDAAYRRAIDPKNRDAYVRLEYRIVRPDGKIRWWQGASRTVFEGEGDARHAVRLIGTVLDVTERVILQHELERALHWSEQSLRATVLAAPVAIITADREGRVMSWNPAAEHIFGYTTKEAIGGMNPAIPPEEREKFRELLSEALEGPTVRREVTRLRKDGTQIDVSLSVARMHGESEGCVILAEDISDRKRAEAELTRSRAALAEAAEEESRRIARDIHDGIAQNLSVLAADIGRTAEKPPRANQLSALLNSFRSSVLDISNELWRISHRLHPSALDDLGLSGALEELCDLYAERHGIRVRYHSEGLPDSVPDNIATCLYRVAQEALNNCAKHANAPDVFLSVRTTDSSIEMNLIDSGIGFDTTATFPGLGLHSMRERVLLVNGTLAVESVPHAGTRITARVPISPGHKTSDSAISAS